MSYIAILSRILMHPFIKFGLDSFINWTESLNLRFFRTCPMRIDVGSHTG